MVLRSGDRRLERNICLLALAALVSKLRCSLAVVCLLARKGELADWPVDGWTVEERYSTFSRDPESRATIEVRVVEMPCE
jgi:hypothetical protein